MLPTQNNMSSDYPLETIGLEILDENNNLIAKEYYKIIDPNQPIPSDPGTQLELTKDRTKTKLYQVILLKNDKVMKGINKKVIKRIKLEQNICIKQRFTHAEVQRRTQTYRTKLNLIIQRIREVNEAQADELKTTVEDTRRNTMLAYLNN